MTKKKPKWTTDPAWALRRANKKGRLPEEVEKLFVGEPGYCLTYAKAIKSRLPPVLEESIPPILGDKSRTDDRTAANWIITYRQHASEISAEMEHVLIRSLRGHVGSRYDWGVERALKYATLCEKVPDEMERMLWGNEYSAFRYSMQSGKRIPAEFEAKMVSKFEDDDLVDYSVKMFGGRMPPELEVLLTNMPDAALAYAKEVMTGRLPEEIHTAMVMKSFGDNENDRRAVCEYMEFVKMSYKYTRSTLANFDRNATVGEVLESIG